MTLVLTEVSALGIAMASDTAVTTINLATGLAYAQPNRARKLQVVTHLAAGVSCWGLGEISGLPTDRWLSRFIENASHVSDVHEFAHRLADQLNIQVGENPAADNRLGFHVAGFVDQNGDRLPAFYHVHDGPSTTLASRGIQVNPHKFNPNQDIPPDVSANAAAQGVSLIIRNGDYQLYAAMFQKLEEFFSALRPLGVMIPNSQDVGDRAQYLVFQIRTIASLYRLSNLIPGIGGGILHLAITREGIHSKGTHFM